MSFLNKWAVVFGAVLGLAGCEVAKPVPAPTALNETPIKIDDAMAARQWSVSEARYQNDHVTARSTLFKLTTKAEDWPINAVGDPGLFVANVVLIPYEVFDVPAWKPLEFKAMVMPPTYSGNPPVAASTVSMEN